MFGYRWLPEFERIDDFAHRSFAAGDEFEDLPASRLCDGVERIGCCRCPGHGFSYTFRYRNMSIRD